MSAGQASSVIHSENYYASGQKKRPRGPRSIPAENIIGGIECIPQHPALDLETLAIGYYRHYHLQGLTDRLGLSKSADDDVLSLLTSRPGYAVFDLGVSSVALAVFSHAQKNPPAAIEASVKYNQLLQLMQSTVQTLNVGNIDACLLAVFFMGRYEDAVHHLNRLDQNLPFLTRFRSFSHHKGALAILKIWKDHLSHRQPATNIIKHIRRGLIRSALLRSLRAPDWMSDGAHFGEHGLELDYDRIIICLATTRQRLSALLKQEVYTGALHSSFVSEAKTLAHEAKDMDMLLRDWAAKFPNEWYPQRHTLSSIPSSDFYSPLVYSYSHPAYVDVWNQYYSTRILINGTRSRALELLLFDSDESMYEERLESFSNMETAANDLASNIPFCLGKLTASHEAESSSCQPGIGLVRKNGLVSSNSILAAWPLLVASLVANLPPMQKIWFRTQLVQLGRVLGFGVFECAGSDQWIEN